MEIDYNGLAAWAAVAAALVAAMALWTQLRSSRFAQGLDLLLRLDERFNTGDMLLARRRAARGIVEGNDVHADTVLDFFEMVGMLVKKGVLDGKMTWHSFFFWLNSYWHLAHARIALKRGSDPTVWADAAYLHAKLVGIEMKERRCSKRNTVPSSEALGMFLKMEAKAGERPPDN